MSKKTLFDDIIEFCHLVNYKRLLESNELCLLEVFRTLGDSFETFSCKKKVTLKKHN